MEAWKMVVTDQLDGRSGHRRLLAWLTCYGKRPDQSSPQYGAVDHADLLHLSGFWFPVARHHTELVGDGCLYPRTSHDAYGWRGLVRSTPAYIHLQMCVRINDPPLHRNMPPVRPASDLSLRLLGFKGLSVMWRQYCRNNEHNEAWLELRHTKYEHIKTSLCALQALTLSYVLVNIKNKGVIASTLAVHVRIYTRKF